MANNSPIEWTDATWNPIVGCSIVSPGCTHCYAMAMAARIEAMGNQPRYAGTTRKVNGNAIWTGKLAQAPESVLLAPLKRKKPTTYFVNSMGDLFHEDCPDEWIDQVFAVMALSPQHTFQVLTKRAGRMRDYMTTPERKRIMGAAAMEVSNALARQGGHSARIKLDHFSACFAGPSGPFPNVWLGVSTERQQEADERIPLLLQTPAAVRFISAEPLLGPIDLTRFSPVDADWNPRAAAAGAMMGLHWVITGGESGHHARPSHPEWFRDIRDACAAAGVAYFHKQNGEWAPCDAINVSRVHALCGAMGSTPHIEKNWVRALDFLQKTKGVNTIAVLARVGKKAAGRHLDGVLHDAMPQGDGKGRL